MHLVFIILYLTEQVMVNLFLCVICGIFYVHNTEHMHCSSNCICLSGMRCSITFINILPEENMKTCWRSFVRNLNRRHAVKPMAIFDNIYWSNLSKLKCDWFLYVYNREAGYKKNGIVEISRDVLYWILFCTIIPYNRGTVLSTNVTYIAAHQSRCDLVKMLCPHHFLTAKLKVCNLYCVNYYSHHLTCYGDEQRHKCLKSALATTMAATIDTMEDNCLVSQGQEVCYHQD